MARFTDAANYLYRRLIFNLQKLHFKRMNLPGERNNEKEPK